jgi:hypothetical protein
MTYDDDLYEANPSASHFKIVGHLKIDCAGLSRQAMAIYFSRYRTYFCYVFICYLIISTAWCMMLAQLDIPYIAPYSNNTIIVCLSELSIHDSGNKLLQAIDLVTALH